MKNNFISAAALIMLLLIAGVQITCAQDSVKKIVKKTVVKPRAAKTLPIDPATGKPKIPINPKTGRPYSIYHGYVSNPKYAAANKTVVTDTTKRAAPLKAVTPPVVVPPPSTVAAVPVDKSLNGQYQYLLTKVYNYQQPFVAALWKNVIDSLNAGKHKLAEAQAKITDQTKTIADMQAAAKAGEQQNAVAGEMSFMGIGLPKSTYNGIMWGLVVVLAAVAGIVIARSGRFKHEANYRIGLYNELEEEYKSYKAKANEKEKKLARELQTERNKVDELMGRG